MFALSDGQTLVLVLCVVPMGLLFAGLMVWSTNRQKLRTARLEVLRKALDAQVIDEPLRRQVVEALSATEAQHDRGMRELLARLRLGSRRLTVALGWLMMVFCGGMWLLLYLTGNQRGDFWLVAAALAGLALVSLPMALREYDRKSVDQAA